MKVNNNQTSNIQDQPSVENAAVKAQPQTTSQTEQAKTTLQGDVAFASIARRTPSRLGEQGAATNMLKAGLLQATAKKTAATSQNGTVSNLTPSNSKSGGNPIIYINGIEEWAGLSQSQGQTLADNSGSNVTNIYQQSTIGNVAINELATLAARAVAGGLFGNIGDEIKQIRADLVGQLQNPQAASVAAQQIISQLGSPDSTSQVHLVGYSQGGQISAESLKLVQQQLTSQYGADTANQMLSRVHVLTLGGAATRSDFPSSVDFTEVYHKDDLVSQVFGDNKTSILGDVFHGLGLAPHLTYFSDPNTLSLINKWQAGQVAPNQTIQLAD